MQERKPTARTRRVPLWIVMFIFLASLGAGAWYAIQGLVMSQAISEGRSVADFAESVGKWASQYGGVHVRTIGLESRMPGTFLTRATYAVNGADANVLQGSRVDPTVDERAARARVEAYHWKNPALVQREMADVINASGSRARYRLTAGTVLNPSNAPNAMEQKALDVLRGGAVKEYWEVNGRELFYARAVVAQASCLKCHDKQDNAPEYIVRNAQFNGGGGFGYVAGKPAGLISVSLPLPRPMQSMREGLTDGGVKVWLPLLLAVVSLLWMLSRSFGSEKP